MVSEPNDGPATSESEEPSSAPGGEGSPPPGASPRSPYLHEGRRIRVRDLVDAGFLAPEQPLVFHRPRIGATHRASVTAEGWIRLDDGQAFDNPSRSAVVASGMRSCDGWTAWELEETGELLDGVRQRFLDAAAGSLDVAPPLSTVEKATLPPGQRSRHEHLKDARARAEAGEPTGMTVADLIRLWGETSRTADLEERVQAEISNHGLETDPDFRKVVLTSWIELVRSDEGDPEDDGPGRRSDDSFSGGLTVGNLPSAMAGLVTVKPDGTLAEALTTMLLHDFSQLPVSSGTRKLVGSVTWRSIAQAQQINPRASLAAAIVRTREVSYADELVDVLGILAQEEFVIVRDRTDAMSGIVTAMDVVEAYGEMATPFFLIGEIDLAVRRIVERYFSPEEVVAVCDPDLTRELGGFSKLTMGDYVRVLESKEGWAKLGWPIDRRMFIDKLDNIREVRNNLMHFNPDPLTAQDVEGIRRFVRVLRTYERMGA